MEHIPVMLQEVLTQLESLEKPELILDATLGLGGYSQAILEHFVNARVLGLDRDEQALEEAKKRLERFGDRFAAMHGNFADISEIFASLSSKTVDAVVFDLGVSNLQITQPDRGFSFRYDGPLDMRMGRTQPEAIDAAYVVNNFSVEELSKLFKELGEERFAFRIAKGIVNHRNRMGAISTTGQLVDIIRSILPAPVQRKAHGHPARRVFQALRIFVNKEMEALDNGLEGALEVCNDGGVIVVVDYHSLEDRMVKWRFRKWKSEGDGNILTRHPLTPAEAEISDNYKARSAKLRAFQKDKRQELNRR